MNNRLLKRWLVFASEREEEIFLALTLVIGALVGLAVVAFIVLTEHMGMRLYPMGSNPWRRVLIPIAGSLGMGYLLASYFPDARGSGVPQTKAALFAREGYHLSSHRDGKVWLHGGDACQRNSAGTRRPVSAGGRGNRFSAGTAVGIASRKK